VSRQASPCCYLRTSTTRKLHARSVLGRVMKRPFVALRTAARTSLLQNPKVISNAPPVSPFSPTAVLTDPLDKLLHPPHPNLPLQQPSIRSKLLILRRDRPPVPLTDSVGVFPLPPGLASDDVPDHRSSRALFTPVRRPAIVIPIGHGTVHDGDIRRVAGVRATRSDRADETRPGPVGGVFFRFPFVVQVCPKFNVLNQRDPITI
jgi:hypothetical protein